MTTAPLPPPHHPTVDGHAVIAEHFRNVLAVRRLTFTFTASTVTVLGEEALERLSNTAIAASLVRRGRTEDVGKGLHVHRRLLDGSWTPTHDIWNSDPPPRRTWYRTRSCRTSMGEVQGMGKLVFGMMQSLDGYVDGVAGGLELPPPGVALHRHFNDHVRGLAGALYGRRMYEIMRYWDEDRPEWDAVEHDFAAAWRAQPKWVVSRTLKSVGANATLVGENVGAFVRRLKQDVEGEIDVAGPALAASLTGLGLIDEYRLYFRPFVLGGGKPYFAGARPPLRIIASDRIGEDAVRLTCIPA